jgi:hypothetical protein
MKKPILIIILCTIILFGCKKEISPTNTQKQTVVADTSESFVEYSIYKGQQYCDKAGFTPVNYSELKFIAKFDSSAIYTSLNAVNQLDINKLFGFSDNNANHQDFSARFGWRWSDNSLYLFGYTYNNGKRSTKSLGTIEIGKDNSCSIKITPSFYIFTLNNTVDSMERKSTTVTATGYKLYPYFGGDEVAPHDIHIWIKEFKSPK